MTQDELERLKHKGATPATDDPRRVGRGSQCEGACVDITQKFEELLLELVAIRDDCGRLIPIAHVQLLKHFNGVVDEILDANRTSMKKTA
jgi:hypothetical protein